MMNRYNVLLIEDDDSAAELTEAQLSLADFFEFTVTRVATRADAVRVALADLTLDAVLLDLELPDASGGDTLADLVSHAPGLAVVALTSNPTSMAFRLLRRGASDFITKSEATSDRIARAIAYSVERKQYEHGIRRLAETDPLTRVGNRRRLERGLNQLHALRRRHGGAIVIAMFDLNDFKSLNDTFGHEAGDRALLAIANTLEGELREEDTVARIGGDEFAVVMLVDHERGVSRILDRLHDRVQKDLGGLEHPTSASAGAVAVSTDCALDELLRRAAACLYRAKTQSNETPRRHSEVIDVRETVVEYSA